MRIFATALAVMLLGTSPAMAYNDSVTHWDLSRAAAQSSVLADSATMARMGLRLVPINGRLSVLFPDDTYYGFDALRDNVAIGARAEDVFPRSIHHFYDPKNERSLTLLPWSRKSPDWALEDLDDISEQADSYRHAREAYYLALTTRPGPGQTGAWQTVFRRLGNVIHHMQDMAQPQHVRNDAHLDVGSFFGLNPFYNPSRYELYTANRANIGLVNQYAGSATPVFPGTSAFKVPRDFWKNVAGSGLADYTNLNFVSQGTNFSMRDGAVTPAREYPSPTAGVPRNYTLKELYDRRGLSPSEGIQALCGGTAIDCSMTMYPAGPSEMASTLSIFDQDLQAAGAAVSYNYGTQTFTTNRIFALNRFNFDDAHRTLIPRAASYSAGLVNYFFRGSLEISLPDEGVYGIVDHSQTKITDPAADFAGFGRIKLKLANSTPGGEAMSGGTLQAILKFRRNLLFKDDLSKMPEEVDPISARSETEEIVFSDIKSGATVGTTAQPFTFTFAQPLPINATDVYLQVVYRGVLGQEQDGVAVTTRSLSEPTYFAYHNFSDYILVDGQPYTRDEVNADAALLAKIEPLSCIDPQTGKLQASCFQPFPIAMDLRFGAGGSFPLAGVSGMEARQFLRLAWIGDAEAPTQLVNTGPCTPRDSAVNPVKWELRYDAAGAATLYYSFFDKLRGVWGWYQTSCVWYGNGAPAASNWSDRLVPLDPVPAPKTLNMSF